jgi:hypothetical protein
MPDGFPRWHNTGGGELCAVCEDELWVSVSDGKYEEAVPCRWCDKGYSYVEAQILEAGKPITSFRAYTLDDVVGLRDSQRELVAERSAA